MLQTSQRSPRATAYRPAPLTIQTLGAFRCTVGVTPITAAQWRSQRACELFLLLINSDGYSLSREYVSDLLWPNHLGDAASNNLRVVLHRMRSALEPSAHATPIVQADHYSITLNFPAGSTIDSDEFRHAIAAARRCTDARTALPHLRRACDTYNGQYLANLPLSEWAITLRAQYAADYADAVARLGTILRTLNLHTELVERMWRALDIDASIADAHQLLSDAYTATGHTDSQARVTATMRALGQPTLSATAASSSARIYPRALTS
jgi:DNA-binding SARP family transcriptional activator